MRIRGKRMIVNLGDCAPKKSYQLLTDHHHPQTLSLPYNRSRRFLLNFSDWNWQEELTTKMRTRKTETPVVRAKGDTTTLRYMYSPCS
jgi:hypothetical protein